MDFQRAKCWVSANLARRIVSDTFSLQDLLTLLKTLEHYWYVSLSILLSGSHWLLQGLPLTPYASDGLGRRAALFIGSFIMLAGVALQFAATSVNMFIGARVLSMSSFLAHTNHPGSQYSFLFSWLRTYFLYQRGPTALDRIVVSYSGDHSCDVLLFIRGLYCSQRGKITSLYNSR